MSRFPAFSIPKLSNSSLLRSRRFNLLASMRHRVPLASRTAKLLSSLTFRSSRRLLLRGLRNAWRALLSWRFVLRRGRACLFQPLGSSSGFPSV
ncbi:MAG: hypothetical protein [Inoviridae sp.]|nr:MAG: hypothetical protein [Inoviridae sp.]